MRLQVLRRTNGHTEGASIFPGGKVNKTDTCHHSEAPGFHRDRGENPLTRLHSANLLAFFKGYIKKAAEIRPTALKF